MRIIARADIKGTNLIKGYQMEGLKTGIYFALIKLQDKTIARKIIVTN